MAATPKRVPIQIRRTFTANHPPAAGSLDRGEMYLELASTPRKAWVGVPTSVHADGHVLLVGDPALVATSLTVDRITAEEITLDGAPLVTTTGGNAGDVLTKQPDESIAWARIGVPDGLVIGNPTGGAKGVGTLNVQGEIYQDGELFEPGGAPPQIVWGMINGSMSNQADLSAALHAAGVSFAQSFAWGHGIEPDDVCMYVNNSGQELTIRAVTGAIERVNGAAAEVRVVRANPGAHLASGQNVADPFDVEQPAGTVDHLHVHEPVLLPDWRLGLRTSGNWQNSVATITVHLGPPVPTGPPFITSPDEHRSEVNLPFSYQIIAAGATSFDANVPPPVGLTVNTATGLISGTPTAAGVTNVTIGAYNSAGSDSKPLRIIIAEAPTTWDPARKHETPAPAVALTNSNMTMSVATGGGIYRSALSTTSRPPGKWYIEGRVSAATLGAFGFGTDASDLSVSLGRSFSIGFLLGLTNPQFFRGTNDVTTWNPAPEIAVGDWVGIAFDAVAGRCWFRNLTTDGEWSNDGGEFGAGANPATGARSMILTAPFSDWVTAASGQFRIIGTSSNNSVVTINPGPTGIANPPAGFFWWDS